MVAPAIVAGGIAAGASLANSAFNIYSQNKTNDTMLKLSRTAHQREVGDLRAAGLNPILSANHGGAASPPLKAPMSDFDSAGTVNSALQARIMDSQINLQNEQANSAKAAAAATNFDLTTRQQTQEFSIQQARLAVINSGLDRETKVQQLKLLDQQLEAARTNNKLLNFQLPGAAAEASYYKGEAGKRLPFSKKAGQLGNMAEEFGHSAKEMYNRGLDWLRLQPGNRRGASGKF